MNLKNYLIYIDQFKLLIGLKNLFTILDKDNIFLEFKSYIELIFSKFFSGIGIAYNPSDYFNIENHFYRFPDFNAAKTEVKFIEIVFVTKLPDSILNINFSYFVEFLTLNIIEGLIKSNFINSMVNISIESGFTFHLNISYDKIIAHNVELWYKIMTRENKIADLIYI